MNFNKVILAGRLTRDPEVKYSTSGKAFCSWGMAINRKYTSANGKREEEVCFVDAKAFGRQAEIVAEYLAKGKLLLLEGRLSFHQYKKDGQKRNKLSVIAERVQLMPKDAQMEESEKILSEKIAVEEPAGQQTQDNQEEVPASVDVAEETEQTSESTEAEQSDTIPF